MRILGRLTGALDWVAGWVILASMFLVAGNVVFRPFGYPIAGTYEWMGFLTALGIGLALAHTAARDGHTTIILLVERFPTRVRVGITSVIRLFVAGFLVLAAWRVSITALNTRASGEVAPTTEIPFWPIMFVVAGGLFIYAIVEFAKVLHLIAWGEWKEGSGPMVVGGDFSPQDEELAPHAEAARADVPHGAPVGLEEDGTHPEAEERPGQEEGGAR